MASDETQSDLGLRDYLEALLRVKWIVLALAILAPTVAVLLALRQPPLYEASAEVLVSRQNLATQLDNISDPTTMDPTRTVETYAQLARVPEVAERALRAAGVAERDPASFLRASSVSPVEETDLLRFSVADADRQVAIRLATEYSNAFVDFRRELDAAAIRAARERVQDRIEALEASDDRDSPLYETLFEKEQQLATMEALQAGRVVVVRIPDRAPQIQPRPMRSGMIGFAAGIVLAIVLALLYNALDSRVRLPRQIVDRLKLPLLAEIPQPPRRIRRSRQLVMNAAPFSQYAEPFRMLRSNIELAWARKPARVIMITSGTAGEGKSTTTANLGISFASSGRKTVLVDLDVAAPVLAPVLGVKTPTGLANVAAGELTLDEAMVEVPFPHVGVRPYRQADRSPAAGRLFVLGAGFQPSGRLDMATLRELPRVFEQLAGVADVVLVDAPPLLVAGDALALTAYVDAVVVVARVNVVRADTLDELHRVLESCPAEKLGAVVTGGNPRSQYYGDYFSSGNGEVELSDEERDPARTSRPRSSRLFTSIRR